MNYRQPLAGLISGVVAGLVITTLASPVCAPKLGDKSAQVLRHCGRPDSLRVIETSYGGRREEWQYSRLVVLEDGVVISGEVQP